MAARLWTGIRERAEHLRRLAVVFAVPLRLKIVTVLYYREMSPKQFHEEYGGGTRSRVTHSFERLEQTFWLRPVRGVGPGGHHRGAEERIYRATELPFFDRETWAALPYSIRVAFSWSSFKTIAQHLRWALEAMTFCARPDRHLTATQLTLDRQGRDRVLVALAEEFADQDLEQEDAMRRVAHTGEELIRAGSILMGFESPSQVGLPAGPSLIAAKEPLTPAMRRLSKVIEDDVCLQIMEEADWVPVSVPLFYRKYGGDFGVSEDGVRSRFKKLIRLGWLTKVGQETGGARKGGVEKFYRSTGPPDWDEPAGPWADVPSALQASEGWTTFLRLTKWVGEAMSAGTFDARPDRCLVWAILSLDSQGWEKVTASTERLLVRMFKEEELAKARMAESGETPTTITVGLGVFESSPESDQEI